MMCFTQKLVWWIYLMASLAVEEVTPLIITALRSDDKALFGHNQFTISCPYVLIGSEQLYFILLSRKRARDTDYIDLLTFQPPGSTLNTTYTASGTALKERTVATGPTSVSSTGSLQFYEIECDDAATYRWSAVYSDGNPQSATATVEIIVKAKTTFQENVAPVYTPSSYLKVGDEVTFTCEGDVGNEPVGSLAWFYYLDGNTVGGTDLSSQATVTAPAWQASTCSYRRTSTLKLTLTRAMNQMVMRCTVQQDVINENGDKHRQTKEINVQWVAKSTTSPTTTSPDSTSTSGDTTIIPTTTSSDSTSTSAMIRPESMRTDSTLATVTVAVLAALVGVLVVVILVFGAYLWNKRRNKAGTSINESSGVTFANQLNTLGLGGNQIRLGTNPVPARPTPSTNQTGGEYSHTYEEPSAAPYQQLDNNTRSADGYQYEQLPDGRPYETLGTDRRNNEYDVVEGHQ